MKSVIRDLADIKAAKRWDFGFHDPEYLEVLESLDCTYPVVRFGDIITVLTDMGAFSLYKTEYFVDEGVPFLRVQNIQEYGVDLEKDTKFISHEYHQQLKKSQLQPGDLLLTTKAVIGISAVVSENLGDCNISQNLVLIRLKDGINPNYVSIFLNSRLGRMQTETAATGPNQKYLNFERIYDLKITLPPRSLQDQIAQVMQEAYGDRQKKLAKAEELFEGFRNYIPDVLGIQIPNLEDEKSFVISSTLLIARGRWNFASFNPTYDATLKAIEESTTKSCQLQEVVEGIKYGASIPANYLDEGILFLRAQNIRDYGLDLSDTKYISKETSGIENFKLRTGDVLITRSGVNVGDSAAIPENIEGCTHGSYSIRLRPIQSKVLPEYLAAALNSSILKHQISASKSRSAQPNINIEELKTLKIPLPSLEKQQVIVQGMAEIYSKIKGLKSEAEAVVVAAKARVERMILGEEVDDG